LGLDASSKLALDGDLRRLGVPEGSPGPLDERPDLRALEADIRQAEVEAELGRAKRLPDLALGASVAREESADIFKGSVSLAIPLFDRGQGEVALAKARRARLRAELEAATSAARAEVGSAAEVARRLASAALRFEERGLGTLERAEELARGSYQAGAIPLGELLALQRELVLARLDYVGLLYGAARARVELASITGALR
jgi:cobalt-zinc-cadmium efflux system outer membrane protein